MFSVLDKRRLILREDSRGVAELTPVGWRMLAKPPEHLGNAWDPADLRLRIPWRMNTTELEDDAASAPNAWVRLSERIDPPLGYGAPKAFDQRADEVAEGAFY
jgi:hypothetical protein